MLQDSSGEPLDQRAPDSGPQAGGVVRSAGAWGCAKSRRCPPCVSPVRRNSSTSKGRRVQMGGWEPGPPVCWALTGVTVPIVIITVMYSNASAVGILSLRWWPSKSKAACVDKLLERSCSTCERFEFLDALCLFLLAGTVRLFQFFPQMGPLFPRVPSQTGSVLPESPVLAPLGLCLGRTAQRGLNFLYLVVRSVAGGRCCGDMMSISFLGRVSLWELWQPCLSC